MKHFGLAAVAIAALAAGCSKKAENAADIAHKQAVSDIRSDNGVPAQQAQGFNGQPQANAPQQQARTGPARQLPAGVFEMQKAQIVDQNGFAQPMLAATLLIPAGWRTQGGIVWGTLGQCGGEFSTNWTAVSPDGVASFAILPTAFWSATRSAYPSPPQQDNCDRSAYQSAREYLEAVARRMHPDVRVLDYRSLPELAKPYQDMLSQFPPLNSDQMQTTWTVDAGELLVAYTENGREMRETLAVTALINHTLIADVVNPGQVAIETIMGIPTGLAVVRAPDGQLDFGLSKRISTSMRIDPKWDAEIKNFYARQRAQRDGAVIDAMTAAHKARMDAIKATGDMINGNYRDSDLTSDRMQRERIEAVRGVETYNDPVYGGPVQLDATYDHAWRVTNKDTYILTDDPNFNPGQYDIQAQQLQVIQ